MTETRKYIIKNKPLPDAQNLEALKEAGIKLAKKYSGDIWTDYNDHDPGVTILENLCYGITEMSYMVNFDFEKLFFAGISPDVKIELENYFLLNKHEVSYSNPVTELDYRKLLLDLFGGEYVKNVWVRANDKEGYTIWVHAKRENDNKIATKIKAAYNHKRNFGEYCKEVVVLVPTSIHDYFKIIENQLSNDAIAKGVAQFIYDIKAYIEPGTRYAKSIKNLDLTEEEKTQLFHGPRPENKFIHPADLAATEWNRMVEELDLEEFINEHNEEKWNGLIKLKEGKDTKIKRINKINKEVFVFDEEKFYNNESFTTYKERIEKAYKAKSTEPLLNGGVEWETYQPQPNDLRKKLEDYHSVQHSFPPNYKLGMKKEDLSHLENGSINQIQNLQYYLLLFESLLVDYLVKIISFPELLKVNEKANGKDIGAQTFSKILKTIPGAEELLEEELLEEELKTVFNQYSFDIDQQIKLREYALARYGETFDTDLLKRAWGMESNDLEFKEAWLKQLDQLIKCYTEYCESRHNSYDILNPDSDFPLSQKLSILLNQEYKKEEPTVYIIEASLKKDRKRNSYKVAAVIDLKKDKVIASKKRERAIIDLIKRELPFYLSYSSFSFFLTDNGEERTDITLDGDKFRKIGPQKMNREAFKKAYENWREEINRAEDLNQPPPQDVQE